MIPAVHPIALNAQLEPDTVFLVMEGGPGRFAAPEHRVETWAGLPLAIFPDVADGFAVDPISFIHTIAIDAQASLHFAARLASGFSGGDMKRLDHFFFSFRFRHDFGWRFFCQRCRFRDYWRFLLNRHRLYC